MKSNIHRLNLTELNGTEINALVLCVILLSKDTLQSLEATLMDLQTNTVVDIQLVQVGEKTHQY